MEAVIGSLSARAEQVDAEGLTLEDAEISATDETCSGRDHTIETAPLRSVLPLDRTKLHDISVEDDACDPASAGARFDTIPCLQHQAISMRFVG